MRHARSSGPSRHVVLVGALLSLVAAPTFAAVGVVQNVKLFSDNPIDSAGFGVASAILDDTAIIGAWGDDAACPEDPLCFSGAAYVFRHDDAAGGWLLDTKLLPDDPTPDARFGHDVAVSGETLAVGAYRTTDAGADTGAVYLFERDPVDASWGQVTRLVGDEPAAGRQFGFALDVDGLVLAVGAPIEEGGGAVHVFEREGGLWTQTARLQPDDVEGLDLFGFSVEVDGDRIVAGAPLEDEAGLGAGAVYVFERSSEGTGWEQVSKLTASDGDSLDLLGGAVALDGPNLLAGAAGSDGITDDGGAAYLYVRSPQGGGGWEETERLASEEPQLGLSFGVSVGLDGPLAVFGAYGEMTAGDDAGALYVFEQVDGVWGQLGKRVPTGLEAGDLLGISVAVADDRIVGGATGDDDGGESAGASYLFQAVDAPILVVDDGCGEVELTVLGARPSGDVEVWWSATAGAGTLPSGPCSGTAVDLAQPSVARSLGTDIFGELNRSVTLPPSLCGGSLQAVDLSTCTVSNVELVQ